MLCWENVLTGLYLYGPSTCTWSCSPFTEFHTSHITWVCSFSFGIWAFICWSMLGQLIWVLLYLLNQCLANAIATWTIGLIHKFIFSEGTATVLHHSTSSVSQTLGWSRLDTWHTVKGRCSQVLTYRYRYLFFAQTPPWQVSLCVCIYNDVARSCYEAFSQQFGLGTKNNWLVGS